MAVPVLNPNRPVFGDPAWIARRDAHLPWHRTDLEEVSISALCECGGYIERTFGNMLICDNCDQGWIITIKPDV